ncbi:hypothetical protein F2P79_002882 [Pimephales promelas]|nr:hypothetical protein F2P79_002882 [Pimephales promelas]KAG1967497.1 hypothetical protein F2P79_002882 [Pimephales promelas]KAG1967499.1 hypothetical protein F2P79_002882 [Pimephales promelas]
MIEVQNQQGVVLGLVSLACLGCVYALCLCCRKKSNGKVDNRQSNRVIRQNHREMPSTSRQSTANMPANRGNIHWSYQNLTDVEHGILEPTYVDPIPNPLYANNDDAETYENVFPTKDVQHDSGWCFQVTMCYPAINSNIITIYF